MKAASLRSLAAGTWGSMSHGAPCDTYVAYSEATRRYSFAAEDRRDWSSLLVSAPSFHARFLEGRRDSAERQPLASNTISTRQESQR